MWWESKKAENEGHKKEKKIDYNFDLRLIFLLLSIRKINIFNEKRNFSISYR